MQSNIININQTDKTIYLFFSAMQETNDNNKKSSNLT